VSAPATQGQRLPAGGPEREALREKGQFWTPDWVAEAMVGYVLAGGSPDLFDPAVGAGVFFRAARRLGAAKGRVYSLSGAELDPITLNEALAGGLSAEDLQSVQIADFVLAPPGRRVRAIVANPPYIRHHRLPAGVKAELRHLGASLIGRPLDGRAGIHVYFLLRALQLLEPDGRLAFIVPADTCEGVFAGALWDWVSAKFRIEAVVTFAPEASPFPGVDTNPVILMIRRAPPRGQLAWARCLRPSPPGLLAWAEGGLGAAAVEGFEAVPRDLGEAVRTGLSRPPASEAASEQVLSDYVSVARGIATGSNEFFLLTCSQAEALGIPPEFLRPAVGRTRDVPGDEVTPETLRRLEEVGRPTCLLSLDGRPLECFPPAVQDYIRQGERAGLPTRPLLATRRPWYRTEVRAVPPFLFAYLGRRNARFVRNLAGVVPLTSFLCVYPHAADDLAVARLWEVLRDPRTVANLALVGKSYGGGAIKVEPRALERLPLPAQGPSGADLPVPRVARQLALW